MQVWTGTVAQIRRAPIVAAIWKDKLQSGVVTLERVNTWITDGCNAFLNTISRLNAAATDPVKGPLVDVAIFFITNGEHTTAQVRNFMGNLRNVILALRDADRSTQALCVTALDQFIADVPVVPDTPGSETIWT